MLTPEELFHHRLSQSERKLRRIHGAPTVPKYNLTGPALAVGGLASIITMSEIGWGSSTTLGTSLTVPIAYQNTRSTDMIFVLAMAPSIPSSGATPGTPYLVTDTGGGGYNSINYFFFEPSAPTVNTGVAGALWYTDPFVAKSGLTVGTSSITVTWDHPVFDRYVSCWLIRFNSDLVTHDPDTLVITANNDLSVYTASQVALSVPGTTSLADGSFLLGNIIYAVPAGSASVAFGGASGYSGFVEVRNHGFSSSRQSYSHHIQSAFANALLINSSVNPVYEIDQGLLDAGDVVSGFNGLGQAYSVISGGSLVPFGNFWKGAMVSRITN